MFFYFRIVMAMYLKEGKEAEIVGGTSLRVVVAACALVTLIFGILPTPLIRQAASSGAGVAARAAVLTNAAR